MARAILNPSRQREFRSNTRRKAIVQLAAVRFLDQGYAGTTMSGIAAALGGSKGTLWRYFPSKELLFVAVVDRLTEEFYMHLSQILNECQDFESTMRRFCQEFVQKITSPQGYSLLKLVVAESRRFPEIAATFNERCSSATQLQLAEFLSRAIATNQLRQADPLLAAKQLMGLCRAGAHYRLLTGAINSVEPADIERDSEDALALFLLAHGTERLSD